MRVVHIITGLHSGGAERVLVDHLSLTRHEVQVITLATEGRLADDLRSMGIRVTCVHMRSNRDLVTIFRLAALLRRLRPDVVHVHLFRALVVGRIAARLAGVPVIASEHSAQPECMERQRAGRLVKAIYRLTERLGALTIAISDATRLTLIDHWGIPSDRIIVIPNGIFIERFTPDPAARARVHSRLDIPEGTPVTVTVSRLSPEKRVDMALRLLTTENCTRWHHIAVGNGTASAELRELANTLGVSDRVHFVGDQCSVSEYLAAGDVFLQLSDYEIYGISAVEAVAAGLPVVYRTSPALESLGSDDRVLAIDDMPGSLPAAVTTAQALGRRQLPLPDRIANLIDIHHISRCLDEAQEAVAR